MVVVEQGVDGFLQYVFFVVYDDVWSGQVEQVFQMVVMVDYLMIQVVQVGSCEVIVIQWNQWMQVWWQYWQDGQDYLFRFVVGVLEGFYQFQVFGQFFDFGF